MLYKAIPAAQIGVKSDSICRSQRALSYSMNQQVWIDDRDQPSKRILTFLMLIFSLTVSAPTQAAPVVTIPAR